MKLQNVEDIYPLSPMQKGLLFHSLYAPDSGLYVAQIECRITAGLCLESFKRAWQQVVDRHPVLRSSFVWEGLEEPLQVVRREVTLLWHEEDWRGIDAAERAARLESFLETDGVRRFELSRAPLMSLVLIRTDEHAYHFLWNHHHLLLDGWATTVVLNELFAFYEARRRGEELVLERPRPYRDYIAWLQKQDLGQAEAFWRRSLQGFAAPTPLAVERPQPETGRESDEETLNLPADVTARLETLARRRQLTLNTVLQGAWALLLSRYSGEPDVVFGATVSGRPAELTGVRSMLGLFINTLPVRVRVRASQRLGEYLRTLQDQQVEARQYEHSPLVDVQGWSEVPRDSPLFESLLVFENYPVDEAAREQAGRSLGIDSMKTVIRNNFPLTLRVHPGRELGLDVLYDCRRFDRETVRRLLGHLATLLEGMAAGPETRLGDLPLMTGAERRRALHEWNDTAAPELGHALLPELFEKQVGQRPAAVAAVFGEARLSYAALDERANRLAQHLRSLGVGPESRVGLFVERSLDMLVGLWGILKAGGAYVPLDPEYPRERLDFMLRDSGVGVLVSEERLLGFLPETEAEVICLDRDAPAIARRPATAPAGGAEAHHLAYMIYTSGSTGRPKGVAIEHAQLANYVRGVTRRLGFGPGETFALVSTPAADLGNTVLFPALAGGGCLHVMSREKAADAPALGRYFEDRPIDHLKIVPSHIAALRLASGGSSITPRRRLIVGGEASSPEWVAALRAECPALEVVNHYGPTESTVGVLTYRVGEESLPVASASVPLGRPLPNVRVHVLDPALGPVPVGVAGELWIGGSGLARGYWGRGGLTAEKFVPDPHGGPGSRLYRTGDLACYLPGGAVEFLGRLDDQVKVRGFRIELGEIEAVLSQHPRVGRAAVVVREDEPGERRLVAYVVGRDGGAAPGVSELREYASSTLPEYMVPSFFVALECLPLTPNGKLDRSALPAPEGARPEVGGSYAEPRTEAERTLAEIWADVLGLERVGVDDNFFELGGDSILCIQVIARARNAGYRLTLKQIFQEPTIAGLARVAGESSVGQVKPKEEPTAEPVSLTPIQAWFFEQEPGNPHHFNQAVLLELKERLNTTALAGALAAVVRHHDALRLRFECEGASWRQVHANAADPSILARVDLSSAADPRSALEAHASQVQSSLDITTGPLLRGVHYDLGAAGERLLLVIHHLAVDGVSWRVLLEDLERAYEQARQGRDVELPAKTTSFQEWSKRLAAYAESEELAAEAAYWTSPARQGIPRLPVDFVAGTNTVSSARSVSVSLDAEKTRHLLQDVPGVYRTQINDVLLAALARVLSGWTGSSRVLVELEGHGREDLFEDVDLSRTVGWFTSLYPLLLDLGGCQGAGEMLKSVKEQIRGVPRHGIGHGVLRCLGSGEAGRRLRELPQAEVRFNYLGQLDQVLAESGPFAAAPESSGASRSPDGRRPYSLDVNACVAEGRLRLDWTYSEALYRRETVEALADRYLRALAGLIEHCLEGDAGGCTPSDFPLVRLDQSELDRCLGPARDVEDLYPLSPMQQGLLFHALYAPQSGVYFEQLSCRFEGGLDVAAFKRAWQAVVDRHATLRSAFVWEHLEEPLQVVRRGVRLEWHESDWRGLDGAEQDERVEEFLRGDRERGFDLARAPLMRLALLRLGDDVYRFAWSYPHALLDGWSSGAVIGDLFRLYGASSRGEEPRLERPRPYRDYIAWLREQDAGRARDFWRRTLEGFRAPTRLAVERAPAEEDGPDPGYASEVVRLSRPSTERLEALARRLKVTLNTVVQGAWALLLSRYSGEEDVVFGATVSGRPPEIAGVESMLGLFINTLPVRVRVRPKVRVARYLSALQEQQAEARQYEYSPLVDVQGWSELRRGTPLFESLLVFENYPIDESVRSESDVALRIDTVHKYDRTSFPLALEVSPGRELRLILDYEPRRLEGAVVRRLGGHLERLLEAMAADPEARLGELALVTVPERRQLLREWNDTTATYSLDRCFPELFEEQARRTPRAVAVTDRDTVLDYAELSGRVNALAARLVAQGVGPETVVAVIDERGADLLVAVLAILKSGGVYLPLDPRHPTLRRREVLRRSGAGLVLAGAHWLEEMAGLPQVAGAAAPKVLALETDLAPADELPARLRPDQLAYVLFTSGSTGTPKGAMIEHRGLINHLHAMIRDLDLGPGDRMAQTASQSFDISVWQLLTPLLVGGTVDILRDDVAHDAARLLAAVDDQGITVLQVVPSLLRDMLRRVAERPEAAPELSALRWLSPTGEALAPELCRSWFEHYPSIPLLNAYGPTECSDDVSLYVVDGPRAAEVRSVPIGRPLANMQLYVLDERLEPLPVGLPGELFVGGVGVGRGYLGNVARTAESFVPDLCSGRAGARLYRTGDLARQLGDGNLEFVGRIDHQVKVRGHRIELGEVETVLGEHPSLAQAVGAVREDRSGSTRLIAYLVRRGEQMPGISELREFVGARLPEYMVPSVFVELERLPLTPNGKVDRSALPAPEASRLELDQHFVAPRTAVEEVVANVWADVLDLERVGAHDDFFEIGGHSLIATRVLGRLRDTLGVEVPLRAVFEHPTVAGLSEQVEAAMRSSRGTAYPPITRRDPGEPMVLSFAQQRLWFLDRLEPGKAAYNEPTAIRVRGPLDVAVLGRTLNEIVRRHEVLRTTFEMIDGVAVQVVSDQAVWPLGVVDLAAEGEAEQPAAIERHMREVARAGFDLERGPLVRGRVLRLGEDDHAVLLAVHHIVSDGWSMGLLIQEVTTLYEAFSNGETARLPELPIQYADYARWQRDWLRGEVLANQVSYWKEQLRGLAPVLQLPTDRPRPAAQTYRGAAEPFELSAAATDGLTRLGRRQGVTSYMALLAAFQVLLGRYAGVSDVAVGSPIAGRPTSELEGLIGFFVNTLVMRTDLAGCSSVSELLARVREVALGAYAHQDVPFEKLVEELEPERNLSHHPLFQVMFIWQNAPGADKVQLPDLTIEPLPNDRSVAKFDLLVSLFEASGRLHGLFEYSTDLFDRATIRRMTGHFATLLEAVAADPDAHPAELRLNTRAQQHQLLGEWNATAAEYPTQKSVQALFEEQAGRTPAAVAVAFDDAVLSYAELDRRSNQLAHHLRGLGVGPEVPVAISVERSLGMVVGLFGILKAGGAYVPLDPQYPRERLAFMLEDSGARVLLAEQRSLGELPAPPAGVVCLDRDGDEIARHGAEPPRSGVAAENLAYVIYTSGSTGRPKGVQISHRSLVNFVLDMGRRFEIGAPDRLLSVTTLSFDIFGLELYVPLTCGAEVRVASREATLDGSLLAATLAETNVTVMQSTPATWRLLLASGWRGREGLKLLSGGEALSGDLASQLLDKGEGLWNLCGPTETTIWSALHEVGEAREPMPIGRAISNTELYVLDRALRPVPAGVAGELYIGGDGLARGYLGRESLTAEKLVPNPFAGDGTRLYRTGDLARYLPDGNLEFLGRIDHQVKVRGFRIELGEIETVLDQDAGVAQSVVVAREDRPGEKRLVAYVVADRRPEGAVNEIDETARHGEQVPGWQKIWDETYTRAAGDDPTFDIQGWMSSYTGQGIPAEEMREWVDRTVEQVVARRPRRVLEIGCGTGLLLYRIAPQCEEYWATDFSPHAIGRLREHLEAAGSEWDHVRLMRRMADDFTDLPEGGFDAVILNSVVQYFPHVEYLVRVLEGAVRAVRDGGVVFVGDVRSLPLLETFHASVQLHQAPAGLSREALRRRVHRGVAQEKELVLDPAFFQALTRHLPRLGAAEIALKRGHHDNELTRFRYDATLHVGAVPDGVELARPLDWEGAGLTLGRLREVLAETRPGALEVTGIPNARLAQERATLSWLAAADGPSTAGALREELRDVDSGVDPEELHALGDELSYTPRILESREGRLGCLDVVFTRRRAGDAEVSASGLVAPPPGEAPAGDWRRYANDPLQGLLERQLVPRLRGAVQDALPDYMSPAAYVVLDALPTTPNGKVDRRALPAPDVGRPELAGAYEPPSTPLEETLAEIWAETLGLERVGVRENFFELGGDSFQIMKVVARAAQRNLQITPRMMFRYQTVGALAEGIYDGDEERPNSLLVPFSASGEGLPFFCVHPAGGRVQPFWPLARGLGADRLFYGIRSKPLSEDPASGRSVESMAADYVAQMRTVQPHGPYCLGGYSVGVFLAFEMARQITAAGEKVALLALLDAAVYRPAPEDPYAIRHLVELASQQGGVSLDPQELGQVPPERLMDHVLDEIEEHGNLSRQELDVLRELAPVGYANKLAVDEYMTRLVASPHEYPCAAGVTVFRAAGELAQAFGSGWTARSEPDFGWGRYCESVEAHTIPGDHDSMLGEPHVTVLAEELRRCLERADEAERQATHPAVVPHAALRRGHHRAPAWSRPPLPSQARHDARGPHPETAHEPPALPRDADHGADPCPMTEIR